jgi:hypothetical protein
MVIIMSNNEQPTKAKVGRPRKPSNRTKGAMMWVSAEYIELVNAYLDFLKKQHGKQAKQ